MSTSESEDTATGHHGYAAIVSAAATVVSCAHAEAGLVKLAGRFLSLEWKRWGGLEDGDDE